MISPRNFFFFFFKALETLKGESGLDLQDYLILLYFALPENLPELAPHPPNIFCYL